MRSLHLVTVAPAIPDPASGGGGNWGGSFIRYFVRAGHRVTHVAVIGKHSMLSVDRELIEEYRELGVDIVVIPYQRTDVRDNSLTRRLRVMLRPSLDDLWPNEAKTRPLVLEAIQKAEPDCVLPFAFDPVLYTHGLSAAPRVSFQAEGPHINTYVNWRYDPAVQPSLSPAYLRYSLRTLLLAKLQEKVFIKLTAGLTIAGFGGPHYVKWAHRRGLTNTVFVTTPVADPVGGRWRELRAKVPRNLKCKILMIGHLHSTSNRSGLPVFFDEILPTLEREWGADKFEIHIVGQNDAMPERFNRWRDHQALRFRGPVYPAHEEFLSADILLVPIPAKTGSRVRIINGFSYGCCVVAHSANALGIPELVQGENVLMAGTGKDMAREVMRAAKDPALRTRLGENGRRVYERFYTEEVGGRQYLALVERAIATFHANEGGGRCVATDHVKYSVPEGIKLANRPCWCGSWEADVLYRQDRWSQHLQTVVCRRCGTIRLEPRMTKEQADTYYNSIYPSKQANREEFFREQKKQNASGYLRRFLTTDMRMLDYGCGPGGKLINLVVEGYRIDGYDSNQDYMEFARRKGLGLYQRDAKYECIYLSHTIEHWVEPLTELRDIVNNNLRDGGLLAVEVPLIDRLLLGDRRNGIQGDIYFVHTWYFSVRSLDKLMGSLRCKRLYSDRATLCVYQFSERNPVADIRGTPFRDWILRKAIDVCSITPIGRTVKLVNRLVRYVDVYQSWADRCVAGGSPAP